MRHSTLPTAVLLAFCLPAVMHAQAVKRERPHAWEGLVLGGRFMDRFAPMPVQGVLTSDTWGADNVLPRYVDNGIEDREWSYWGGKALCGDDGKYHLFVCRWREDSEKGHHEWHRSIVVHAIADRSTGPYRVRDTVGPGHNPEVFRLQDGRYVIYVIGHYYISKNLHGPWQKREFAFDPRGRKIIQGLSNLTFARREDGSFLMICRGGGVWFSKTGVSPYRQVTDQRVYPAVDGRFEDPVVWRTNIQYHLIVNDWLGRIAYYLRSSDGIHWKVDPGEAYLPGLARYEDGTEVDWFKFERIKVLQDEYGRATQAHFAVIDVLKNDDKGSDNHSSKHICIPLTVGRLVTILNTQPITADTPEIRVRIKAEQGFDPQRDVNVYALRLGAPEEVNFGRGCKMISTQRSGEDLIVTFDGTGNGITSDNFTAKLIGTTSHGKLLFGYARLPGIDYLLPALSASDLQVHASARDITMTVTVGNFGQVASTPTSLSVVQQQGDGQVEVASTTIPPLQPFEETELQLAGNDALRRGKSYELSTIIRPEGQPPERLRRVIKPSNRPAGGA